MRKSLPIIFLILLLSCCFAVVTHGEMKIYAITEGGEGLSADLIVDLEPGSGRVWTDVMPLVGTSTQSAALTAVKVAGKYSGEVNNYDYKFDIRSDASVVEGGSAGAAMALMLITLLKGRHMPGNVSITGTINEDGYIGAVGGVYQKAEEAAATGVDLFMIPKGEAKQTIKVNGKIYNINLQEYAPEKMGIKVAEVSTIGDALEYAFADIEDINITIGNNNVFHDFVPQPIKYSKALEPMKKLTSEYIAETKILLNEARNALSTTLLNEPRVLSALLESLKVAEDWMKEAELLNDHNYLYSAANYVFLAKVDAMLVKDISENPSLLKQDSTAFDMKLNSLKKNVDRLENDLDGYIPLDRVEWYIAAQQRLTWAKLKLAALMSTKVIVVDYEGGIIDDATAVFGSLKDYEFAVAWYDVAEDFWLIAEDSSIVVRPEPIFTETTDEFIVKTEDALTMLEESNAEDIKNKLNAAKDEKKRGWYMSSIFNAASAYALAKSSIIVRGKDANELYSMLEEKINGLDANIGKSSHAFVWATLYLDHAKYFKSSADYYHSIGQPANAASEVESGIGLIVLAEQLHLVSEKIYEFADSIDSERLITEGTVPALGEDKKKPASAIELTLYIVAMLLLLLLVLLLILLIARTIPHLRLDAYRKHYSIGLEIKRVKKLQRQVDEAFALGRISEEKHAELAASYAAEQQELEKLLRISSAHLLEIDRQRAELLALEHRLRDLKNHYKCGFVGEAEYKQMVESYRKKMSELSQFLREEKLEISVGKARFMKFMEEKEKAKSAPLPKKKVTVPAQKQNLPVAMGGEQLVTVKAGAATAKKKEAKKAQQKAGAKKPKLRPKAKKAKKGAAKGAGLSKKPSTAGSSAFGRSAQQNAKK